MRLPYEYWLKYLILHPKIDDKKISDLVQMYGLAAPSEDYLESLSASILASRPKPYKLSTQKVRAWLRRQRVYSLMYESEDAVEARTIFDNARLVRTLQFLLMADTPRNRIPDYCKAIVGTKPTVAVVKMFEHYFWNRNLLSYHEWQAYLKPWWEGRVKHFHHADGEDLLACYEQGPEYALWKLGYREEIPTDQLIRGVLHEASMRFFETGQMKNTRDTAMTAKMWSETIFKAVEELGKTGDAVQQVLDQLKAVAIKLENTNIKGIEEVTGGEYSSNPRNRK